MFYLTASTSEVCPTERSSCATTRARSSRYSTTTTWSGCRRRRRRLTYVVSPGDVTDQLGRFMARRCLANGCHPVGSVFLLRNRSFTRSTTLLPATGTPSWISSPRAVQDMFLFERSIKRLALPCMVLGTMSTTSASIPLVVAGAPTAPSAPPHTYPRPRLVHRDHACRFIGVFIGEDVIPLQ